MGLFRSRTRKNRGKASAELLTEQTATARPPVAPAETQVEVARREVRAEQRPNPDQPGWGTTIGQQIGKPREDRSGQE